MKRYFSETGVLRVDTLNQILNLIMEIDNEDQYYLTFFVDKNEGVSEVMFGEVNFCDLFSTTFKDKNNMSDFILRLQDFVVARKKERVEDDFDSLFEYTYTTKEKELIVEYIKSITNKKEEDDEAC